jgi:hypothetical protein
MAQHLLSAQERRLRQEAADYARSSVELSGFKIEAATLERARLYVEGQLTLQEFVAPASDGRLIR